MFNDGTALILISFERWVVLHRHVVQNLLQRLRRFVVLILECWMHPSIDWNDDLQHVLTPTVHGTTSTLIPTLQSFLDTLESISRVHNLQESQLKPLKWFHVRLEICSHFDDDVPFLQTPCGGLRSVFSSPV